MRLETKEKRWRATVLSEFRVGFHVCLFLIFSARMAVGCTVDMALLIAQNKLKNGFALVRPPGHHAEKNLAM